MVPMVQLGQLPLEPKVLLLVQELELLLELEPPSLLLAPSLS